MRSECGGRGSLALFRRLRAKLEASRPYRIQTVRGQLTVTSCTELTLGLEEAACTPH